MILVIYIILLLIYFEHIHAIAELSYANYLQGQPYCIFAISTLRSTSSSALIVCVHIVPLPDPETLQELKIPIISQDVCQATYPEMTSDMLCAGDMAGGKDACKVSVGVS